METKEKMAVNRENPATMRMDTVPTLFWWRVHKSADRVAMRKKELGIWKEITWREYGEQAKYAGLGLIALGLEKGDVVTVISENNPEWLYSDMGTQAVGGVCAGIYTTDTPKQVEYVVGHCEAKFYICENEEQLDKILEVRHNLPHLKKIIVIDMEGLRGFKDPMVISFAELLELGEKLDQQQPGLFEDRLQEPEPEDLAILIYTSGTTGPPKGAMISHRNIIEVGRMFDQIEPGYETDEILSFLPLCHIAERGVSVLNPLRTGYIINFAEDLDTVPQNIREISPTIYFAVPRIWEKFYSGLVLSMRDATWFEKQAYNWAIKIGYKVSGYQLNNRVKRPDSTRSGSAGSPDPEKGNSYAIQLNKQAVPFSWRILFKLADWTVLRNVKKVLGLSRARYLISGAAPISPDLLRFYKALGLDMREVYGQTECCGATSAHRAGDVKFGTVGRPVPGSDIRISEEGEILVRGPHVFLGYLHDPEKTKQTIVDGWLHTGDVGRLDEDGHLIITDRMKDIIITAGGKNITPSEIENQLKFNPYITDAVVIGDKRKFLSALIMIDEENVMNYAQEQRIPFTTYSSLAKSPDIFKLIEREVEKVNNNFSQVEKIKKFRLIDIQLTAEDEEITPTMKLKRKAINEKFKDVIEAMYK